MSVEIKLVHHCDVHEQIQDEQVAGETISPVIVNGEPMVMELCASCQDEITYTLLIEALLDPRLGRPLEERPKKKKKSKSLAYEEFELTEPCSFGCGRMLKSNQARLMHERRSHEEEFKKRKQEEEGKQPKLFEEESATEVVFVDGRAECPADDCKRKFKTRLGLDNHITGNHPELAVSV